MRVLVIEDEIRLARNIARVLDEEPSWAVDISTKGEDGRHMAMTNPYDLIILDLGLPEISGLEILRNLRTAHVMTPVLILTARDAAEDIIQGLETGGDDYMVKPFDMRELIARCNALVRRSYGRAAPVVTVGDVAVDTTRHQVAVGGKAVRLSAMEYRLLEYLAMRAGQVVPKADIVEHLYDFNSEKFSNVVEVYICSLRRKLGLGSDSELIHTYRNQGYLLGEPPA
ncbi:MAG: response regulator transcription factor [Sedimentisphaerales bacterium]|jgi:DNA-binding response OmpR family regulator